jgi:hypothetical protein
VLGKSRDECWDQDGGIPKDFHQKRAQQKGGRGALSTVFKLEDSLAGALHVQSSVPPGPFLPLGAEMLGDIEILLSKLPGMDQKLAFLLKSRLLSFRPKRDRPSTFFGSNLYLKSTPGLDAELISDRFRNNNAAVVVDLDFHGRQDAFETRCQQKTAIGNTPFHFLSESDRA